MDDHVAQRQISQAYKEGKRDGMQEAEEMAVILKQFITDDIKSWTRETWKKFDDYMGTFNE